MNIYGIVQTIALDVVNLLSGSKRLSIKDSMRILNLFAGIGGNRKLWENVEVTAVEYNEEIAAIYQEYFPNDKVVVGDAHEYLLKHYKEFDFIWASPPCPTHSRLNTTRSGRGEDMRFPDMKLWQEIIFLNHWFAGKFVIKNVIPYYEPLVKPTIELERHLFWANFQIRPYEFDNDKPEIARVTANDTVFGFSLKGRKLKHRKDQILRNCVNPELGLYILEQAQGVIRQDNSNQLKLAI
jgi:DNA (cytosine-5)-methyltransferase 1